MSQATTVKEVLKAARWIIDNVGWCQGYYRKNAQGQDVYDDSQAACFCSVGALLAVETSNQNLTTIAENLLNKDVVTWNDTPGRTKEEILKGFDLAIQRAK